MVSAMTGRQIDRKAVQKGFEWLEKFNTTKDESADANDVPSS